MQRCFYAFATALVLYCFASPALAIVGGQESSSELKTRTIMVLRAGGDMCSGIILAPDVVLTSGHCVSIARDLRIYFRDPSGEVRFLEAKEVATHTGYRARAIETRQRSIDLALIRLSSPLPDYFFSATLKVTAPRIGLPIVVFGWGISVEGVAHTTGTFRSADLVVVAPHGPGQYLLWGADPFHMGKRPGAGICDGDSGGPIVGHDGAVIAVSTWSSGLGDSHCGLYTQGVLLGPQRGFIDGTLKRWNRAVVWR